MNTKKRGRTRRGGACGREMGRKTGKKRLRERGFGLSTIHQFQSRLASADSSVLIDFVDEAVCDAFVADDLSFQTT